MVSFGYLFHDSRRTPITDTYTVKDTIGTGKFSIVKEAVEITTHKPCALKIMKKCVVQDNNLVKEVEIMRQLTHPNIISLQDIYETDVDLILVLELVTGGELFEKIVERVSYTEEDAAKLVKQIASVIDYLHKKDIVHCDLKPENLLYSDTTTDAVIKLCDFGLSQVQSNNAPLTSIIGTPTYMAPEIRACVGYGKPVDMWSLGVIVYILLCGFPPFDETTGSVLEFPSPEWDDISTSAKDLITNLLVVDTYKRFNVQQAMAHLWVSGATAGKQSIAGALKTMRVFNTCRKSGTTFRGSGSTRASVFGLFPEEGGERKDMEEEDKYPAADSPAFFTIHNPMVSLEMDYSPHSQSPSLIDAELTRGGSPTDFERKVIATSRSNTGGSGTKWEGADSKELLARELGLLLQNNPQILRTLSESSNTSERTATTQAHALEDLMNSLTAGMHEYGPGVGELVRPLSGHFTRVAHMEEQLKDAQFALEHERNARYASEENTAHVMSQLARVQGDVRRLEIYAEMDKDLGDMVRGIVNTLDGIIVNNSKAATTPGRGPDTSSSMMDALEGLKEENTTLDRLYRQTKAELEELQLEVKGGGQDSLRKKNKQLTKQLERLHKEHDALLQQSKSNNGQSDEPQQPDDPEDDSLQSDKRVKRGHKKDKSTSFLKKLIG